MPKILRAYISSTYSDLVKCRKVVYDILRQLGYDAVAMEDYVAADVRPLDKVLEDIRQCDLYIGIIGFRYGYIPENYEVSITQSEFQEATKLNLPKLIFLLSPAAPMGKKIKDDDQTKISRFRKHVTDNNLVSFFENQAQLGTLVSVALRKWEIENNIRSLSPTLNELKFPKEIRIRNYIPEKMLSVRTSLPQILLILALAASTFWMFMAIGATFNSISGVITNKNLSIWNFVPLIFLSFGVFSLLKGPRIDFNLVSGKATIGLIAATAKTSANPNDFKIKIRKKANKFQAKLTYGFFIIAKSTWFESKKAAIEHFYPFVTALQSELGLNQIRIEG